jgi:hypothetical protein
VDSKPIIIRIVFIKWELYDDYFTIAGKEQKYTEVTFSVDYQIENTGNETIIIEYGTIDEIVNIRITSILENQNLNLTFTGRSIDWPKVTNRTYEPGVENRSRDFSFRFNTQGLSHLPNGWYNITPNLEGHVFPEKYEIASYGVILEVSGISYSIFYEHDKKIFHYSSYIPSVFLGTIFLGLLVSLSKQRMRKHRKRLK